MKTTYSFLLLILCSGTSLLAQNWTGAVNSNWNNPANWSSAPANGDDIEIDPANYTGARANPVVTGTSNFTPAEMLIQNGALLVISGTLNATDRVEVIGNGTKLTINSGTFALTGPGNNARLIFVDDAHLQMENGALNVGQRLLFELGASGEINNGTVTVGETIALVDGSILQSSKLVQNGGTITTNGEFGFENEAGTYYPSFEQHGGILQINGDLLWLGAAPGAGRGDFKSTGGKIVITGIIGNDPASTMGMKIELLNDGARLENSGTAVRLLPGDSIVINEGASWWDINTVNWQNDGTFHCPYGIFRAGNTTLNGTGSYQFDLVQVSPSKKLDHVSPQEISISGHFTVKGVFNHHNNKLILNGNFIQVLTDTSEFNLYDLEVRNTAGNTNNSSQQIVCNNTIKIAHHLHLTDGLIKLAPVATIKLVDNATITGGSDTTFVDGYIEKTGNEAIEFPIGKSPDRYRPLAISAPASASTLVRAGYKNVAYTNLTPVQSPFQSISMVEYWDLSRSGSSDLFTVTAGWNNAAQSGLTDCAAISLGLWNGTQWTYVPSTSSGLCNGNNEGELASTAQLPVIGPLSIGFTNTIYQNPVKVCTGESYTIGTNTYTESGIYIDILEDQNGDDSTVVTILEVLNPLDVTVYNGTTYLSANAVNATNFQWIDCNNGNTPIPGAISYEFHPAVNGTYAVIVSRNDCEDRDTSECFTVAELGVAEQSLLNVSLYPNPVESMGAINLFASGEISGFKIRTLDGRLIVPASVTSQSDGMISIALPALSAGTYLLSVEAVNGYTVLKRFVVKD